jgi:hypothetical protein
MSSQKGITKLQLDVTLRAIILHFCKRGKAQNPYSFNIKLLLQNNPEVKAASVYFYEEQYGVTKRLNNIYEKYGHDAFEQDDIQWLDQSGSLISLKVIPAHIIDKYELGEGSKFRIRDPNLEQPGIFILFYS